MTGTDAAMPDRRLLLLGRDATLNGLDFAEARRGRIDLHFINRVRVKGTLARDRPSITLAVSGAAPAPVVHPVDEDADWSTDTSGRPVLRITADIPDAPARYTVTVHSDRLDPCFRSVAIAVSGRHDGTDRREAMPAGQLPGEPAVPIDYMSKDFASFCQALIDFSTVRYPQWAERSEADFGLMLMELLSALADELSYLQDRIAGEATLDGATQRLSLVRHARLVDYEPAPAMAASTVIQLDIVPATSGGRTLRDVIDVQALGGQATPVNFTAGSAFAGAGARPRLDARWNRYIDRAGQVPRLIPYLWDATATRLRAGATSMWISGHCHGFYAGQELLIDTAAPAGGDPPIREIIRLIETEERTDPVHGQRVTRIRWSDGLASDHDLTRTQLAGNLLRAVHGRLTSEEFVIPGGVTSPGALLATVRADHAGSPEHCLHTLTGPLAWQSVPATDGQARPRPMLDVQEFAPEDLPPPADPAASGAGTAWQWVPRLLDADATAPAFTITPERYSPPADADGLAFADYDGDGTTIRFGDGTFGRPPVPGTTFRARYVSGGGDVGNVAADTIVTVAPGDPANGLILRCTNPFPAVGGADAETFAQVRDRAPQQTPSGLLTLTEPADYQETALSYSTPGAGGAKWARNAVAAARWTGSWLSTLTIADPLADEPAQTRLAGLAGLAELLRVRRLAGADVAAAIARYRWIDLRVSCAAMVGHHPADVAAAVLARLAPWRGAGGTTGFFGRDRWTFGQPLEASALIAAIQSCRGVAGVTRVDYRRASGQGEWHPLRATVGVARGEILRIDNDRDRPGHGLLFVTARRPGEPGEPADLDQEVAR